MSVGMSWRIGLVITKIVRIIVAVYCDPYNCKRYLQGHQLNNAFHYILHLQYHCSDHPHPVQMAAVTTTSIFQ